MNERRDDLMERLERLERSQRRLKLLSFVAVIAICTMGAAEGIPHTFDTLTAKLITAQGINIVDANGKLRVSIGADAASEQAGMSVFQRDGIRRVDIGTGSDSNTAGLAAYDALGSTKIAAINAFDNSGLIATFEPSGPLGAYLDTVPGPAGFNGFFVNQPDGTQRANIISSSTSNFMQLVGPAGQSIGMSAGAEATDQEFNILDSNSTIRATIAATDPSTGSPFEIMRVSGPDGFDRAQMQSGFGTNNGLVQTFDSTGTQTGQLGTP
jgi:hypothetical protein